MIETALRAQAQLIQHLADEAAVFGVHVWNRPVFEIRLLDLALNANQSLGERSPARTLIAMMSAIIRMIMKIRSARSRVILKRPASGGPASSSPQSPQPSAPTRSPPGRVLFRCRNGPCTERGVKVAVPR